MSHKFKAPPAELHQLLPHSVKIYDGPSLFTGERIFVIAAAKSQNRKIGRMLQLWVIPALSPIEAVKTGRDEAVCGDCKLRGDGAGKQRACYVEWWRSVANIHFAHERAEKIDPYQFARLAAGEQLRVTAYGDPMAVPVQVWEPALRTAAGWTAYTHQWKNAGGVQTTDFRSWCMASVDSVEEQLEAEARGWRTFRIRESSTAGINAAREVVCPHEVDAEIKCASCSLCRGNARPAKSIVVTVHGQQAKWFKREEATV
jgi:hypothetical protein